MSLFKTMWNGCTLFTIVYPSRKPKKLTNNVREPVYVTSEPAMTYLIMSKGTGPSIFVNYAS